MLPPLDTGTLTHALIGGVGGVTLALAYYVARDWRHVLRRWRTRHEPGALADEENDSEYHAFPVTEEERRNLPRTSLWFGAVGAAGYTGFMLDSDVIMVALFAVVSLVAIVRILFADNAQLIEVGDGTPPPAPPSWTERFGKIGAELLTLAMLAVTFLDADEYEAVLERLGLDHDGLLWTVWGLLICAGAWSLVELYRKEPEEDAGEYVSPFGSQTEDIQRTMAGLAGALVIVAVVVLLLA